MPSAIGWNRPSSQQRFVELVRKGAVASSNPPLNSLTRLDLCGEKNELQGNHRAGAGRETGSHRLARLSTARCSSPGRRPLQRCESRATTRSLYSPFVWGLKRHLPARMIDHWAFKTVMKKDFLRYPLKLSTTLSTLH